MDRPRDIVRAATYLPVRNVGLTGAYYHAVPGVGRGYDAGAPPEFAIHSRGAAAVMLKRVAGQVVPSEAQGGTRDLFFWVTDVDALFDEFVGRHATVA